MKVNFNVLNQKSAPALYEGSLADRPAPGYLGRLFIDTDIPSTGIYWDSGTVWYKIASASIAETQSLNDVCVIGNSTVTLGTYIYGQSTYGQKSGAAIPVEPNYALTIGRGDSVNDKSLYVAFNSILNGLVNVIGGNTASNPGLKVSGGWYSGGSATTTKPQLLVEPDGTTSTAWSTLGTGIGINAATGFTGRLFDFQINAVSKAILLANGNLLIGTSTDSGFKLDVVGVAKIGTSITAYPSTLVATSISAENGIIPLVINTKTSADTLFILSRNNGAQYASIYMDGGGIALTNTSSGFNTMHYILTGAIRGYFSSNYRHLWQGTTSVLNDNTTPSAEASAILALQSTSRGFLPPKMTTVQKTAITTPSAGLMVYDTTLNKLCVFTTAWETITSI